MLAATLYSVGELRLEDRERPEPGNGEAVIRVRASGLCPTDVKTFRYGSSLARYPVVLGHEVCGTVTEVGEGVETLRSGALVNVAADAFCGRCSMCLAGHENLCSSPISLGFNANGAHAEYMTVPAQFIERGGVFQLDGVEEDTGSMIEPLACSLHSLNMLGGREIRSLVIIGDGPMGMLHLLLARELGIERTVITGLIDWKLDIAERNGAAGVVDSARRDPVSAVRYVIPGGADAVAVTAVTSQTLQQAIGMAAKRGKITIFAGLPSDRMPLTFDSNAVHYGELTVNGSSGYTYSEYRECVSMLGSLQARLRSIISQRFRLNELFEAIRCWDDKNSSLKIVLTR